MRKTTLTICLLAVSLLLLFAQKEGFAAPPVSYSQQILPVFKAQCLGCHSGATPVSGYSMETRDKLLAGGRRGAAVIPGKGALSNLIRYMTGDLQPKMPPSGAMDGDKIALIRRWIDEGAKVDSEKMPEGMNVTANKKGTSLFSLTSPHANLSAPVTALAYSPDGKMIAVGGYRVVRLIDSLTGTILQSVKGATDQVQCVAWSADGKFLAVAGGVPGAAGEVLIVDCETWKPLLKLEGHSEVVYAVAWKPDGKELATGSLDKTVNIWNAKTGKITRTLKDHAEGIMGVAYSPDGKLLATGSLDRSAKLFDTTSWKRIAALTAHQDGVTRVAFNKAGTILATSGLDRTVRIWLVKSGTFENPERTLYADDAINTCAFSPDSNLLVWGASNRIVKAFNGDGTQQKNELKDAEDCVYCLGIGSDNETVVAGTQDGKLLFWNLKQNKLIRTVSPK